MDNLYFYLTLFDDIEQDRLSLSHGFSWGASAGAVTQELTTLFVEHYQCSPDLLQCRLDKISAAEIIRVVSQRVSYDERPLRVYGVVITLPLPDEQRDLFVNIAMADSEDELKRSYYDMLVPQLPQGYDLNQIEFIVDEYDIAQILAHIADRMDGGRETE